MAVVTVMVASFVIDMRIFADIQFTNLFASVIGILFSLVVCWRIWLEYARPVIHRRNRKKERKHMRKNHSPSDENHQEL